jgi:hypothetical protein
MTGLRVEPPRKAALDNALVFDSAENPLIVMAPAL